MQADRKKGGRKQMKRDTLVLVCDVILFVALIALMVVEIKTPQGGVTWFNNMMSTIKSTITSVIR
jgi:uncharacterized membrane protein